MKKVMQSLIQAITDGTVHSAEPGELLTRIVDILAIKPTKSEIKLLKEYGFNPVSDTHFSNDDDTLVKFKLKEKYFWLQVEIDSYEFSMHNKLSNFMEGTYEKEEAYV